MTSLWERLHASELGRETLEFLLHKPFNRAQIDPNRDPLTLTFYNDIGKALHVRYSKDGGGIVDIAPGESLTEEEVSELEEQIKNELANEEVHVRRDWAFSSVPTTGAYRYRDLFQLVPPPDDAPKPGQLVGSHPLLLEVAFAGAQDEWLHIDRGMSTVRRVALLLNVFIRFGVHAHCLRGSEHVWVYSRGTEGQGLASEYRQRGYAHQSVCRLPPGFTRADRLAPERESGIYYAEGGVVSTDDTLTIPSELTSLCDAFYGLQAEQQAKFERACYWFHHSTHVRGLSVSACYTAIVQAVESLLAAPHTYGRCGECGRDHQEGPTKQFKEFVDCYAAGFSRDTRDRIKNIYNVRSKLTHGHDLLMTDSLDTYIPPFIPKAVDEESNLRAATDMTRILLVNWLSETSKAH